MHDLKILTDKRMVVQCGAGYGTVYYYVYLKDLEQGK